MATLEVCDYEAMDRLVTKALPQVKTELITDQEEMLKLTGERFNPPDVPNGVANDLFDTEIKTVYEELVKGLSLFGAEGDYYGVSDFAVRPDLRIRPTVIPPPAPRAREFQVTLLSEVFFQSDFLKVARRLLLAFPNRYRIVFDQGFDPAWYLTVFLTADVALVFCTDAEKRHELRQTLLAV